MEPCIKIHQDVTDADWKIRAGLWKLLHNKKRSKKPLVSMRFMNGPRTFLHLLNVPRHCVPYTELIQQVHILNLIVLLQMDYYSKKCYQYYDF